MFRPRSRAIHFRGRRWPRRLRPLCLRREFQEGACGLRSLTEAELVESTSVWSIWRPRRGRSTGSESRALLWEQRSYSSHRGPSSKFLLKAFAFSRGRQTSRSASSGPWGEETGERQARESTCERGDAEGWDSRSGLREPPREEHRKQTRRQ